MKGFLLTVLFSFFIKISWCQFYYNDIISLKQSNEIYGTLKKNNIKLVTATSVESDNTPTAGFFYKRQIVNNAAEIITDISLEATGATQTAEYYNNDRLSKSVDSSSNVNTIVTYQYDEQENISVIQTLTNDVDTLHTMHSLEMHKWFYTNNIPDSMLRIKDNADSTIVHFKKDDKQNITEEIWMKRNRIIEHYFYYYNDESELTDIVRFNTRAKQMLPDFLFAYNTNGTLSQLTQIPQGSSDYVTWQYVYDDKGLKTKDVLFDKHQQLLGTVTYNYQ